MKQFWSYLDVTYCIHFLSAFFKIYLYYYMTSENVDKKIISAQIKELINKFETKNNFDCCVKIDNIISNTNIDLVMLIVWDKSYNDMVIEEVKKKFNDIELIYSKEYDTTLQFTENFLREAHMKRPWWEKNLKEQSKLRFNENKSLTFHIFTGTDLHENNKVRNIKKAIRRKFNLSKVIFHFSDPDDLKKLKVKNIPEYKKYRNERHRFLDEFYNHFNLLMNKNTLHFLKNSVYNESFSIHKFYDEYCEFLFKNDLNSDNFLMDNGGVLALYGLRESHDLDWVTSENVLNILGEEKVIGCENDLHKKEFEVLKLTIPDIINNPEHHFYHYRKKCLDIKILKKFKYNRTKFGKRKKDIRDYKMICDNFNDIG